MPMVVPMMPEPTLLALTIMASSAEASLFPIRPPSSATMAPCAASRPKARPATAMAASSMGASEKTVKKAIEAPRLMARSFHQPANATFRSRHVSESMQEPILPGQAGPGTANVLTWPLTGRNFLLFLWRGLDREVVAVPDASCEKWLRFSLTRPSGSARRVA